LLFWNRSNGYLLATGVHTSAFITRLLKIILLKKAGGVMAR